MKVIIYGFGRMGLTHFAILNAIRQSYDYTIIEPNHFLRSILNKNLNSVFYEDDKKIVDPPDLTLITTPPFAHCEILIKCIERGDKKIFIEKPFGGCQNTKFTLNRTTTSISIGYVLRYNPCIQWAKYNICVNEIASVSCQYLSNTIGKKPTGWRNGHFSGVLNEMGSHMVDLILYLTESVDMDVTFSKKESIISDNDDIINAELKTSNNIPVKLALNWIDKNARKPIFQIKIKKVDGTTVRIDQQQITTFDKGENILKKISVTQLRRVVPYYLRGVDFTDQMLDFIGNQKINANLEDGIRVNRIMKKIIGYETNTRR